MDEASILVIFEKFRFELESAENLRKCKSHELELDNADGDPNTEIANRAPGSGTIASHAGPRRRTNGARRFAPTAYARRAQTCLASDNVADLDHAGNLSLSVAGNGDHSAAAFKYALVNADDQRAFGIVRDADD